MGDFYRFENRFIITATLEMETPLSVGSRISLLPAGSDLPVMKTPEGMPFVPGSSLKGVIRAHMEQLLRMMEATNQTFSGQRLEACDPLDERSRCVIATCCRDCEDCAENCCSNCGRCKTCMVKQHQRNGLLDDEAFTQELVEKSCTACRLFGSPWLASRMHFQDAMLVNGDALLHFTEVREGVGIDRDLGTPKPRIKFDFEVVPAGAKFDIRIVVENAGDWEVGLLLLSLKAMERGELPLGGKTTRGLGWGRLQVLKVERITSADLLHYLQGSPPPIVDPESLIQALTQGLSQGGDANA